jgi:hypothetical protein
MGAVLDVAKVIWCTGFLPDFSWIDLPVYDRDGEPRHERGAVRSEPGLYFIVLFFLSAESSSLIGGVAQDARRHRPAYRLAARRTWRNRAKRLPDERRLLATTPGRRTHSRRASPSPALSEPSAHCQVLARGHRRRVAGRHTIQEQVYLDNP